MGADTKTVDVSVLTVLDYLLRLKGPRALTNSTWQELSHARAAIAELIEANEELQAAIDEEAWMSGGRVHRARDRHAAALRAVGGAE